ncbi:microcin C ABC transporter ATP-binding protein YejF [Gilliamella apis]|uniref:microcin C ABC transporter ATP-binding protein YejF n=1 Tax=Gilliamella apis TaxID=1970738 RepID=UPI000A35620B|nr:microcin C ABC transporter ATP-binding protein YejF [Gilliamella apis]OTQ34741.1 microcin C ABC transporter ATP-binding protein YejF [Gilliamella apis]OTQ36404.1 microcin C ABC transporter ATP-binding protein YejF [Gilliamella apis]OTQ39589.1 microcin C ABC transporter ATP-binding protein YejF [Gilliamella apis]OTQ42536.1 microcin C ABC transporter ATP-binding protein YejF [Gilliamella apis]OTQ45427.1 microcin C ABC transporter ATP-binding protein YejF [Gilliamella apis]
MSSPLLSIIDLSIAFKTGQHSQNQVVDAISFDINEQETVALVGESGSGKSVTALSILRLLSKERVIYPSGDIIFEDKSLLHASEKELRKIRGNEISMIFQEPMVSLNPLHTVEKQLYEVLSLHRGMRRNEARSEILQYLDRVGIKDPKSKLASYPHQLSGGERQRVMIAMAILTHPKLLIADEPTTALDVSVQGQIIELLKELKKELNMSMLFISHNLGIVKKLADKVAVMQDGQIVEFNNKQRIFLRPQHEYTQTLLNSQPSGEPVPLPDTPGILLNVNHLNVEVVTQKRLFSSKKKKIVDNIGFAVHQGETVGIVGESGSGKSTTALAILRLIKSKGDILFDSHPIQNLSGKKLLPFRSRIQVVFQDPFSSLNPRFNVEQIISEGLMTHKKLTKAEREQAVIDIMLEVGLDPEMRFRYPNEFSGGQRQRIAIARALILQPELLILDEPTSSLDHTIQKQIINLLKSLQEKHHLSYLFISHDLALVYSICHQIVVMKDGKIVEQGSREKVFYTPESEYTKVLLSFLDKPPRKATKTLIHADIIEKTQKAESSENVEKDEQSDEKQQAQQEHKQEQKVNWEDALLMRKK